MATMSARSRRASRSIGTSPNAPFAITADASRHFYAVQFHPEVHHTPNGARLYENFVQYRRVHRRLDHGRLSRGGHRAASASRSATAKVICGLSGGVDSSVAAMLIHEAIGDQLTCVFRRSRAAAQERGGRGRLDVPRQLQYPAHRMPTMRATLFLGALDGESDPETKRKTIGRLFIDVFQKHAERSAAPNFLAQGTLYPGRDRVGLLSPAAPRSPSSRTTMSAACPRRWG